jgi:hypothetical protein
MAVIANGTAAASASRPSRAPRAADARTCSTKATASASESRIDILSRAYEPVTFDVNLMRGQSATFRHTLAPIMRTPQPAPAAAVKAPPAPKQPVTSYLIPGCYMGDEPPKKRNLPAT